MDELERSILDAWKRVGPAVLADPRELTRRLARRRTNIILHPPRAWCLAVRASDRRINARTAAITPEHAIDPRHHPAGVRHRAASRLPRSRSMMPPGAEP